MKNKKYISEIHFWQFTQNIDDETYLNSISNLHKTNGKYSYYRNIYPAIYNNNYFVLKINFAEKGKSCLLINDKYEIIFNVKNNIDVGVSLNISNKLYYAKQTKIYKSNVFLTYIIMIINY